MLETTGTRGERSSPALERLTQVAALQRRQECPSTLPLVSVVVPAYNSAGFVSYCLRSLFAQSYPAERYEIILVDDGSTDDTAERARQLGEQWAGSLRVITKANGGPASARNAGIRAATGDVVAFTDSDCIADPDWLVQLVAALCDDPGAAGVGGPLCNVSPPGWVAHFLESTSFYRHRVRHGLVDYLLTANVAFRRDALLAVHGFAEREGAWCEDADLSFRLKQAGYRLRVSAAGRVTHYGTPRSVRGLARELYRYGHGNSVLSRNWTNGRTPLFELARHTGGVVLAPVLALRLAPRLGVLQALSFIPLFAIEHAAFSAGLVSSETRMLL
ncbi:MAG TPA: glycosyltransferase, partial [Ktedonobacterales bacterium]